MIDLERKIGPLRLRAWGLVANFGFNALGLYGLAGVMTGNGGLLPLVVGGLGTLGCIALLAVPSRA